MKEETISDIIAEMRNHASGDAKSAWYTPETWRQLCDRIEAAANELKKQSDDFRNLYQVALIDIAHLHDELKTAESKAHIGYEAIKEMERLRAALKPVMECDASGKEDLPRTAPIRWEFVNDLYHAVRTAQEIMKGEK